MNSNLFPRSAFEVAAFDETIDYGYDDVDLCGRLIAAGYRIEHRPELLNRHLPAKTSLEAERIRSQRVPARFYVTLKRHLIWQRNLPAAGAYVVVATAHEFGHRLLRRGGAPAWSVFGEMKWALAEARRKARIGSTAVLPTVATGLSARSISICICSKDRPNLLKRCLGSIARSTSMPDEVVVADDSDDPSSTREVCNEFSFVRYVRTPRRGQTPSRNEAIRNAQADYISFLDDDAVISPRFVERARKLLATASPDTIFTGNLYEGDQLSQAPGNPTFLGHYKASSPKHVETVHMNSNLFPRKAFDVARFDETIHYGYVDVDLCFRLLDRGYRIEHQPELVNRHLPPEKESSELSEIRLHRSRARFYVTLKRHLIWRRSLPRALAFICIAPLHEAGHRLLRRRGCSPRGALSDMRWAVREVRNARRSTPITT
jgi:GT2 family glycosyltransferase